MSTFVETDGEPAEVLVTSSNSKGQQSSVPLAPDGYPENLDIHIRYIKGMGGDMVEARRRWIESLKWREAEKVDTILDEPVPRFDIIKKYYPHFYFKTAKNGCHCYYEIPAGINLEKLRENGLKMDSLCRHYIYITEFLWKMVDTNPEGKLLTIMDLKGIRMSMFVGDVKDFVVRSAKMISAHYPERSFKIFIINAPWWFNIIWKVVSPLLHANTRAKVIVCGSGFIDTLRELVDDDKIPKDIGGSDPTPHLESPEEMQLRAHILKTLKENNMEMTLEVSLLTFW
ncbi:unnamed protein product [Discosporangium mesarthrocarpum]